MGTSITAKGRLDFKPADNWAFRESLPPGGRRLPGDGAAGGSRRSQARLHLARFRVQVQPDGSVLGPGPYFASTWSAWAMAVRVVPHWRVATPSVRPGAHLRVGLLPTPAGVAKRTGEISFGDLDRLRPGGRRAQALGLCG
jgi:hypothetical protein